MRGSRRSYPVFAAAVLALLLVGSAAGSGGGLLAPGDQHAADAPVALTITGPESIEPGDPTTVSVEIRATQPVYGAEVSISHTPTNLSVNDVSSGGFLAQNGSTYVLPSGTDGDTIEYAEIVLGEDAGASGTGTLATINLTVPESTTAATLSLSFEEVQIAGENASAIDATTTGTNITIEGRATATATGSSPTESATATGTDGTETSSAPSTSTSSSPGTASPTETTSTPTETSSPTDTSTAEPTDTATASPTETTAVRTETASPTASNAWRRNVDSAVFDALEADGQAAVIVRPQPNGSLGEIQRLLNATGATDVRRLAEPAAVTAVVSAESLQPVAISEDVEHVGVYSANESSTATDTAASGSTDTASDDTLTRTETTSVGTARTDSLTSPDATETDDGSNRSTTATTDDGPAEAPTSSVRSATTETETPLVPLGFVAPVGAFLAFVAVRLRY